MLGLCQSEGTAQILYLSINTGSKDSQELSSDTCPTTFPHSKTHVNTICLSQLLLDLYYLLKIFSFVLLRKALTEVPFLSIFFSFSRCETATWTREDQSQCALYSTDCLCFGGLRPWRISFWLPGLLLLQPHQPQEQEIGKRSRGTNSTCPVSPQPGQAQWPPGKPK